LAPDLFSYRASLWHQRKVRPTATSNGAKTPWPRAKRFGCRSQGRCCKRAGLRHRLDRCNRNAYRTPSAIAYHDCCAKKKQRRYYSGKKKRHTLKTQLVVERSPRRILCLAHDKGRRHDFRLFKTSKLHLHPETKAVVDNGYQGLQRRHAKTNMPKKREPKEPVIRNRQEK
jgi:hypothetical protein